MAGLDYLFDRALIPDEIQQQLGEEYEVRPLVADDHTRNHLEILSVLTVAPTLTPQTYTRVFNEMKSCPSTYFIIVILHKPTSKIVASGSIILERKFLRGAGVIGHIEDIAVSKSVQGKKLGLRMIHALSGVGERMGCYKIILDCSRDNIPFYEKCGFKHKEFQMVRYTEAYASTTTAKL